MTTYSEAHAVAAAQSLERSQALRGQACRVGARITAHPAADGAQRDIHGLSLALAEAAQRCRAEMLVSCAQHRAGWPEFADAVLASGARLHRTARLRVLVGGAQYGAPGDRFVERLADIGGMLRTHPGAIDRFVLVDDGTVFVSPEGEVKDADSMTAVTDLVVGGLLHSVFDQVWDASLGLPGTRLSNASEADRVKLAILRLLAQGHKDEVVARRLNLGVRTCRRHIAEITASLGASSRFQAGFVAGQIDAMVHKHPRPESEQL